MIEDRPMSLADHVRSAGQSVLGLWHTFRDYLRRARRHELDARGKRQLVALLVALAVALLVCVFIAIPLSQLIADPRVFSSVLHDNYALTAVVYALINTLHVFIAVIPGEPLELGAGFLFGTWGGLIVVSVGLGLGELFTFLLVRRYGTRLVHLFVKQETLDGLVLFRDPKRRNAITFLMMFLPGTPKDIWSYIIGLTPMRLSTWMVISLTARIPSILISTFCGAAFAQGSYGTSGFTFALCIILSVLGLLYYGRIDHQAKVAAEMDRVARREWEQEGGSRNDAATYDPVDDAHARL